MTICETVGLTKRFGELVAVDDVDFAVDGGDVVGIIGPNGAGKTTFVNLIAGVLAPDAGTVTYQGEDVTDEPAHRRAHGGLVRSFQIPQIYEELTLLENVEASIVTRERDNLGVLTGIRRRSGYQDEARELLDRFALGDRADVIAEEIPHGERKVLDVAMSVALRPDLLILDEPTSGVASSDKTTIMDLIMDNVASPDRGIIFVSHDMELISEYSTRTVAMAQGAIFSEGAPETVLNDEEVVTRIRGQR